MGQSEEFLHFLLLFFFVFLSLSLLFCFRFSSLLSHSPRGQGQTTAITAKNREFHCNSVCTDPVQNFPKIVTLRGIDQGPCPSVKISKPLPAWWEILWIFVWTQSFKRTWSHQQLLRPQAPLYSLPCQGNWFPC